VREIGAAPIPEVKGERGEYQGFKFLFFTLKILAVEPENAHAGCLFLSFCVH
jgi:hypothetical protein